MLRKAFLGLGLVALAVLASNQARAHFIWLDLQPAAGGQQARLYFSEEPAPGEPHLVAKAAGTKTWLRDASGESSEVKFAAADDKDLAALVATCPSAGAGSLEGICDYGVYQHGPGSGVRLHYYAKRLTGDWTRHPQLARAERLKLDIVPVVADGKLTAQVLYDNKPAAEAEIVFVDPAGEHHELATDKQGRAAVKAGAGLWGIRAGHVEADRSGEHDGKKFSQTWHYGTLLAEVPATTTRTGETAGNISAGEALVRARDGRAIWHDFPGFSADLTVRGDDGQQVTGKLTIDGDGGVTLDMPESPLADWTEEQLYSLVQHRMPDGEVSTGEVRFLEENDDHPLGQLISLGDSEFSSAYRLKDDVIMEVNRTAGPSMRFTISVLEIVRNAEDKYLPRSFTMNFFDSNSGNLLNSLAYFNAWQRVGAFDLPQTIIEVNAKKGGSTTKEIDFSNCRLLDK